MTVKKIYSVTQKKSPLLSVRPKTLGFCSIYFSLLFSFYFIAVDFFTWIRKTTKPADKQFMPTESEDFWGYRKNAKAENSDNQNNQIRIHGLAPFLLLRTWPTFFLRLGFFIPPLRNWRLDIIHSSMRILLFPKLCVFLLSGQLAIALFLLLFSCLDETFELIASQHSQGRFLTALS